MAGAFLENGAVGDLVCNLKVMRRGFCFLASTDMDGKTYQGMFD